MIETPFIAHSELTNEIYIVVGKEKYRVTEQAIKAVKAIKALEQEPTTKNDLGVDCISREQALRELKESAEHHANDSREEVLLRRDRDIIRALPSVTPQEPRWIPTSARLPEPDVEVLVTDDAGGLATISTDSIYESEATGEKEWYTSQRVTAWMPLPKPYEPQGSEEE